MKGYLKDILIVTDHLDMQDTGPSEAPGQLEFSISELSSAASYSAEGALSLLSAFSLAVSEEYAFADTAKEATRIVLKEVSCSEEYKRDLLKVMGIYAGAMITVMNYPDPF